MASIRLVLCVVVVMMSAVMADDKYTTKFDHIDVDEFLRSDRLVNNMVKCLLGQGKCSPEGRELKANLADAMANNCLKCSEKQRSGAEKVLNHFYYKRQATYTLVANKYDPTGIYRAKLEARLLKPNPPA